MSTPQKKQRRKSLTPTKSSLMSGPRPRGMRSLFADEEDAPYPKPKTPAKPPAKPKPKPQTVQQQIKAAFYDPKTGLWSASKIHKKLKAKGIKVTLAQVKKVLDKQLVTQVYKPTVKPKKERFNKSSQHISYKKTGGVKLSLRLATNSQFLYGSDAGNYSYALYDLRLEYQTVPDKGSGNLAFETIHMIKTTAESNNTSISTRVPAVVQSVSMVFHKDAQLNTAVYNHLQLEEPPAISRVTFSFNDSLTSYYNFSLETVQELLYNYQMSWGVDGGSKSNLNFPMLNKNENFGVGMPFGQYIDMTKGSKFGVNILSDITSALKYGVFMYFRGIVQI